MEENWVARPYFQCTFESICRYVESQSSITDYVVDQARVLSLLAGRPTKAASPIDLAKPGLDKPMDDSRSSFSYKSKGLPALRFPQPDFQISVLSKL